MEESDLALLARFARSGDAKAFAALVARHGPMVMGVCRRVLGNAADAEDAFQAVFIVLAKRAGSVRSAVGPWLHAVALRAACRAKAMRRQREKIAASVAQEMAQMSKSRETPPAEWLASQTVIDEEIEALPRRQRDVVVLCCIEGLTYAEAAGAMECSADAVRGTLARARETLRDRLVRRGVLAASAVAAGVIFTPEATAAVPAGLAGMATAVAVAAKTGAVAAGVSAAAKLIAEGVVRSMVTAKYAVALVSAGLIGVILSTSAMVAVGAGKGGAKDDAPPVELPAAGNDLFGDALPAGAVARLGSNRFRQANLRALAMSPDGKYVASSGNTSDINLWDASTGKRAATIKGHKDMVQALAFSADAKRLASASWDATVRIWDVERKRETQSMKMQAQAYAVAFSPDGTLLAAGCGLGMKQNETFALYETASGKRVAVGELGQVNAVAFSPDGKTVAIGSRELFSMWDVGANKLKSSVDTSDKIAGVTSHAGVFDVAWSPDGKKVALCFAKQGTVRTVDPETGESSAPIKAFGLTPRRVAFLPDGKRLIASGSDAINASAVKVIDLQTGKVVSERRADGFYLALSGDGKTYVAGQAVVRVRDVETGKSVVDTGGHEGAISAVGFVGDAVVTAGDDGQVRLWDGTGKCTKTIQAHTYGITSLAVAPNGKKFATAADGEFMKDGQYGRELVNIYDADGVKEPLRVDAGYHKIPSIAFSPDSKKLLTAGGEFLHGHELIVWDVATGKATTKAGAKNLIARGLAYSPDGQKVAISTYDGAVRLLNGTTLAELSSFTAHPGAVHGSQIYSLAWTPDGKSIVTGAEDSASNFAVWEPAGKSLLKGKHARRVAGVAVSSDGTLAASGSADQTIRIWDLKARKCLGEIKGHNETVRSVAFSTDGKRLVSGGHDGVGYVWDIEPFRKLAGK